MNNNVNMAAMNAMGGGPVGAGMPMMNNGLPGGPRQSQHQQHQQQQQQQQHGVPEDKVQRQHLNTYIYEYFLSNEMWDCARALIASDQPLNLNKDSPGKRRDANGNMMDVGASSDGAEDSKDHMDMKRPNDLPAPNLPQECPESCFLFEWWCLFWDMFNAQRNNNKNPTVRNYQEYTQGQNRIKQEHQSSMLRNISQMGGPGGMMMRQPNGMPMGQNEVARKAMMQNNGGRPITQQQMQLMQQRQQQQMQRGGSDLDGRHQVAHSPASGEGAPSPSKRQRIDGTQFNGQMGMPNGRGQGGIPGQQMGAGPGGNGPQNAMMLANGMGAGNLAAQQFQNFGQGGPPGANKAQLQQYNNSMAQQQQAQKAQMVNPNGPQGQGSPMMPGQEGIHQFYGGDMANGARGPGGGGPAGGGQPNTGSHALQDYQMQLMLLEQQNKKRLLMARQEQDSMNSGNDERPPGTGRQQPFPGTSPNGARSIHSPNPAEMMKRGTPQMIAGGIPSPSDGQSRGSPASMNFVPNHMDPNMGPNFYKMENGGMMGPNGMRQAPSSHPAPFPNGQMTQQQMMQMRQAQQQANGGQFPGGFAGPNAAPMMQQQGSQQGVQAGPMGTPQQRAMPPPAPPAAGPNGRTQPSSPQVAPAPPTPSQAKKANPKAKKEAKPKRKAGQTAATTGATPIDDAPAEPATPTPQTPVTPMPPVSFKNSQQNNGGVPNNSQPAAPAAPQGPPLSQPQVSDPQNGFSMDEFSMPNMGMDFAHPMGTSDVLQDFDFDSFLNQGDETAQEFNFDASTFGMEGEVGAE